MNWYKLLVIGFVFIVVLVGCSQKETKEDLGLVTLEEFNQLDNSMTFDDVIELLGPPDSYGGESQSGKEVEYVEDATYIWDGVVPESFIVLKFKNKMLQTKNKMGFE